MTPAQAVAVCAVGLVRAWAEADDERRDGYGYRIRNGLDPSPGDEVRALLAAHEQNGEQS